MTKAAVVILNWNGEKMLRQFLGKVVESLPEGVKTVVADNGSSDSSCQYIEQNHPSVEIIRLDKNYGFATGYNLALSQVDAEYYILLNSDVEPQKGWVEPLIEALDREPDLGCVGPKLRSWHNREMFEYAGAAGGFIDYLGYPFCRGRILKKLEQDRGQYDSESDVFWVSGAAMCCRSELFHRLGGFDDSYFAHMEEIDLAWRMQLAGWRLRVLPQSVVYHVGAATLKVDSPFKTFLNHRNNLRMLMKCSTPSQRLVVSIVRPVSDLMAALSYLLQGHWGAFCAVLRAWREFLGDHTKLLEERKKIRATVKKEPFGIYRGSMLLRYMFGANKYSDYEKACSNTNL